MTGWRGLASIFQRQFIRCYKTSVRRNGLTELTINRITPSESCYNQPKGSTGRHPGPYRSRDGSSLQSIGIRPLVNPGKRAAISSSRRTSETVATSTREHLERLWWLKDARELTVSTNPGDKQSITVSSPGRNPTILTPLFLRDYCSCSECRHTVTKQRLIDTFALRKDLDIESFTLKETGLEIQFNDGHRSWHTREWLQEMFAPIDSYELWTTRYRQWYDPQRDREPPSVLYDRVMNSSEGLREYLNSIGEYGFCFVDQCPTDPEATRQLLERIAFIRLTHYGGFYDFTSDLSLKDTAYTNIALEPHNDNTYFSDAAGLQMLHMLSHTDGGGGLSTLVDGFAVAEALEESEPDLFSILRTVPTSAHASGNADIGSISPLNKSCAINVADSDDSPRRRLTRIRWNNADRASWSASQLNSYNVHSWYEAAAVFNKMVNSKKFQWEFQLEPGRPLIFDNWRMLHGRTAFTGQRRMAGGYINMDDFVAKWKLLNLGNEQILAGL